MRFSVLALFGTMREVVAATGSEFSGIIHFQHAPSVVLSRRELPGNAPCFFAEYDTLAGAGVNGPLHGGEIDRALLSEVATAFLRHATTPTAPHVTVRIAFVWLADPGYTGPDAGNAFCTTRVLERRGAARLSAAGKTK